jgi:uncharacterized membrane protein
MNKNRLEALSDGVFSIVMTLLIFNVTVPVLDGTPTEMQLRAAIGALVPIFASYFTSFAVLAMFWLSHNFFYSSFTKTINRKLVLLNMLYLSLLAFVPFSTRLLGQYGSLRTAVLFYGCNILAIGLVATIVLHYALYSHEIDTSHIDHRLLNQARLRSLLTPVCTVIGLLCGIFNTPLALALFAFPVLFNLIPGTLDAAERVFRFSL